MEDIAQPLRYVFDWYNGVVSELGEAKECIKNLEAQLVSLADELAEVHQSYRESGERHNREMLQKQETLKYFTGVAAEGLVTKIQLKKAIHKLEIAQNHIRALEQERDEALDEAEKHKMKLQEIKWHANNNV